MVTRRRSSSARSMILLLFLLHLRLAAPYCIRWAHKESRTCEDLIFLYLRDNIHNIHLDRRQGSLFRPFRTHLGASILTRLHSLGSVQLLRVFLYGQAAAAILKRAITRATLLSGPFALISPCKISRPRTVLRERWDVAGRMVARVQGLYFWEDGRKDRLASLALLLATLLRLKASKAPGRILTGPWGYNRALPFTRQEDLTNLPGLLLLRLHVLFPCKWLHFVESRSVKFYFAIGALIKRT